MTAALTGNRADARLPRHWPAALSPDQLRIIDLPTPYLVTDLDAVAGRYARFAAALPGVRTFYAMKCNPAPEIIRALHRNGAGAEVASLAELRLLQRLGLDPADVLYSNPVKPPAHIADAYAAGLWRFGFDGPNELRKIAANAPGAAVYLRLRVDDSGSAFPLSRKFGADFADARALLLRTRELGLRPYGITFHVGSQCTDPTAWTRAIAAAGSIMRSLLADGIELEMLNVGGGFPAEYAGEYATGVPSIELIGAEITAALDGLLPYRPGLVAAEPGRHLVAEAAVTAAGVIGREVRDGERWLYLDLGAYNGLMETVQTDDGWPYPVRSTAGGPLVPFTVTGPSCDSSDTVFHDVLLPEGIDVGDVVHIGSTGAYTLCYASGFNGFAPPTPLFVGGGHAPAR